jgi:hypothetical protein
MINENPYRPPEAPIARGGGPLRSAPAIILQGLIAVVLATLLMGLGGLFCSILGVGSWWLYKFWPKRPLADDDQARAYLQKLEELPTGSEPTAMSGSPAKDEPVPEVLKDLKP